MRVCFPKVFLDKSEAKELHDFHLSAEAVMCHVQIPSNGAAQRLSPTEPGGTPMSSQDPGAEITGQRLRGRD